MKRKASRTTASQPHTPVPAKERGALSRLNRSRPFGLLLLLGLILGGLGAFLLMSRTPQNESKGNAPFPAVVYSLAEQPLRATVARLPLDPDTHRALARFLIEQHRPFESFRHCLIIQELRPADTELPVALARAFTGAGLSARVASTLRARLARSPSDLDARLALAENALATARPRDALATLSGVGTALSTSAPAQLLLGDARAATGDTVRARTAYQRMTVLEPEGGVAYDRLGRLALSAGEWAAAISAFTAAREREPEKPGHSYRLGEAYAGGGDRAAAVQLWQAVAMSSPEYGPARLALGQEHQRRKEWNAAAEQLTAAVLADPASKEAQFALAAVMMAQGERASAFHQRGVYYLQTDRPHLTLAECRHMKAIAPGGADGPLLAGLSYIRMQRLDLAAAETERGLKHHPRDARFLARLGLLRVLGRNRPLARQVCEQWLKTDPKAAEPYRLLGRIAREEQRLPESLQLYEQALARDPENATVCHEMSKTLGALPGPDNSRRALDLARQATTLNPLEADHWQELGTLLRGAGRPSEAAEAFLRALDLDPTTTGACPALVQIATQDGRTQEAVFWTDLRTDLEERRRTSRSLWRAVYQHPSDASAHERLARFLMQTGDLRRASFQLQQVVELRPADTAARHDLAIVDRLLALKAE